MRLRRLAKSFVDPFSLPLLLFSPILFFFSSLVYNEEQFHIGILSHQKFFLFSLFNVNFNFFFFWIFPKKMFVVGKNKRKPKIRTTLRPFFLRFELRCDQYILRDQFFFITLCIPLFIFWISVISPDNLVGRAEDCRDLHLQISLGRWFESGSED